jgi:hypothetical protein
VAKEPAQPVAADPPAPPDRAELERKSRHVAEMMAEAIQKKDPELMKKAIEAQKGLIEAQRGSVIAAQRGTMPAAERSRATAMGVRFLLLLLVVSLLIVASMWVIFEKAGSSGWKSLVPIYNMYVLMEVSGKPGWWLLLLFIPVIGTVFYLLAMLALAEKFGRGALFGVGLCLLPMIFFPLLAFGGTQYEAQGDLA